MRFNTLIIRCSLILTSIFFNSAAFALEKVTLQLKWTHAFQFAGYYAAKEQGFYRDAGLDVNIVEATPNTDTVGDVLKGKSQYGVGSSSLLLDRSAGKPVVALAVVFQQSPYEIYAAPHIREVKDLIGKRIMLEPHSDELLAFLQKKGAPINSFKLVSHDFDVASLINGQLDAMSGYVSNEPFYFKQAKFPYQTFSPRSAGIDFYGDNLFTSEQELQAHPARVKAFRAASLRGWQYAKKNRDEVIDLILAKYPSKHTRESLNFESDQMIPLLQPNLIEIGYMNSNRWRDIANTYADIGLLPRNFELQNFLYDATEPDLTWLYRLLAGGFMLIAVTSLIALYIARINRKLLVSQKQLAKLIKDKQSALDLVMKIAHSVPGVVYQFRQRPDGSSCFPFASEGISAIYQVSPEEVREDASKAFAITHPADLDNLVSSIRISAQNLTQWHHEYRVQFDDGTGKSKVKWLLGNAKPERETDGSVLWHGFITDITERKKSEEALKDSEFRWKFAIEGAGDGVWDWNIKTDEAQYSHRWKEMLGYNDKDILPTNDEWSSRVHPDDQLYVKNAMQAYLDGMTEIYVVEYRLRCKDDSYKWILGRGMIVNRSEDGKPLRMIGTHTDITDRKKSECVINENNQRLNTILDNLFTYVALLDTNGIVQEINKAPLEPAGYLREDVIGQYFYDAPWWNYDEKIRTQLITAINAAKQGESSRYDVTVKMGDDLVPIDFQIAPVRDSSGQIVGLLPTAVDITERKRLEDELKRQAHIDYLTGLSNRRHFMVQGEVELSRAIRYDTPLSVLMLDIDYFKSVNDTYGHQVGDTVLQVLSKICQDTLRQVDVAGRLGGEEFAVILPETTNTEALEVAERLREAVANIEVKVPVGLPIHFTVSIGVTSLQDKNVNLDMLINQADKALYEAKETGRNKVCVG